MGAHENGQHGVWLAMTVHILVVLCPYSSQLKPVLKHSVYQPTRRAGPEEPPQVMLCRPQPPLGVPHSPSPLWQHPVLVPWALRP